MDASGSKPEPVKRQLDPPSHVSRKDGWLRFDHVDYSVVGGVGGSSATAAAAV